jgi:hypothetical protein
MKETTMQLSDWFTIITIFLAVLAFFSQAERKILLLKTKKRQLIITGFILCLFVPFLLYYYKISFVFNFLNSPPFSYKYKYLPDPSDWAFLLTSLTIGYWVYWLSFRLKKVEPTLNLINHYLKSMNYMPFDDLFRLFIKYEEPQLNKATNFDLYGILLTSESFFNSALNHSPNLFTGIINNIDANTILASRLPVVIRDRVNAIAHEQKRLGAMSTYNYEPVYHDKWPKEDLLLFHLTDCYFTLMEKCIKANTFDTNEFNMRNFFSETMFSELLKSIHIPEGLNTDTETPTYYHKLLSNTLRAYNYWISTSIELKRELHIIEHFATLYVICIIKLMEYEDEIISETYLTIQFCSFLRCYFAGLEKYDTILTDVEDKLVFALPKDFKQKQYYKDRFNQCWEYSDDVIFAGNSGVQKHEVEKRNRFIKNVVEPIRNG